MKTIDCVIVGAGPAGSSALKYLAQKGVDAICIDKETFPRYKPCGGAISALTARQLDFPWEDLIEASLSHIDLSLMHRDPISLSTDEPFAHFVMRDRFDHRLLDVALEAGGRFYPGHAVTRIERKKEFVEVTTSKGDFRARYVIGADGTNSVVAREIGHFYDSRGIAMEAEIKAPPHILKRYENRIYVSYAQPPHGYGWIFPKANQLSVGVGTFSNKRNPIKPVFDKFLHTTELAGFPMDVFGHPIPAGGKRHTLWVPRIVLVGDAAGLNDPLSGEGIAHGIRSGYIAARHIFEAINEDIVDFDAYQKEIDDDIVDDLVKAAWIAKRMYTFPKAFHWFLKKSPGMLELYLRLIRGDLDYDDVITELSREFLRLNLFGATS